MKPTFIKTRGTSNFIQILLLLSLVACATTVDPPRESSIGTITVSTGFPRVVRHNHIYILATQAKIYQGDIIETDPTSAIKVKMIDDTIFTLGPNSHFVLHDYQYSLGDRSPRARLSLTSGSLRTSTANITKAWRMSFEINTGLAKIKVAGADFWSGYIFGDNTLDVVLLRGGEIRLKNRNGSIKITHPGEGTTVFGDSAPQSPMRWSRSKVDQALSATTVSIPDPGSGI